MKIATANEMREIDRLTQTDYGMPADLLMEKAALAALEVMEQSEGSLTGKRIYLCCGRGNNGGDGLALARLLLDKQAQVTVLLTDEPGHYTGLAEVNLKRAQKFGMEIVPWERDDRSGLE
jgi:NAD(P)H-hydrate repair Nnr-like enzyme with NAD(P)H-hydrate epimerase domain